jgi:protein phosphatase
VKFRFAATTHAGNRGANEDHVGWDEGAGIWVVADGMGGHAAGEVASRITVDATLKWAAEFRLADSLLKAHEAVLDAARADARHEGMGSTVVALRARGGGSEIGWVGDSRAYLWRDGALAQLTRDHSLVQALSDRLGSSEGLQDHRILVQAMGMENPRPGIVALPLQPGDRVLLASDGLTTEVDDARIAELLRTAGSPEAAVDALLAEALARGGHDNVSIIVIEAMPAWYQRWRPLALAAGGLLAVAVLLWRML